MTLQPKFLPWVGDNYESNKPKILVLGLSHYGDGSESEGFTRDVVQDWAIGRQGKHAFFTRIAQAISGKFETFDAEQKKLFWHNVAFYNYIQDIVGPTARIDPSESHWPVARQIFAGVLGQLKPEVVVVLGSKLGYEIRSNAQLFENEGVKFVYWYHPSGSKFNKYEANKLLQEALQ